MFLPETLTSTISTISRPIAAAAAPPANPAEKKENKRDQHSSFHLQNIFNKHQQETKKGPFFPAINLSCLGLYTSSPPIVLHPIQSPHSQSVRDESTEPSLLLRSKSRYRDARAFHVPSIPVTLEIRVRSSPYSSYTYVRAPHRPIQAPAVHTCRKTLRSGSLHCPSATYKELASFSPPLQRDYFHLPSLDLSKYKSHNISTAKNNTAHTVTPNRLPSLAFHTAPAGIHWQGVIGTALNAQNTLPTPPSDAGDGYKLPGHASTSPADATQNQSSAMGSMMDSTATPGSLTARRPAAGNLPNMELPPLPFRNSTPAKPVGFAFDLNQAAQTGGAVVNPTTNLLTPPTTLPTDGFTNSAISATNQAPQTFPQASPWYNLRMGTTPQSWTPNAKGLFSPSIADTLQRPIADSPTSQDNLSTSLPPPPPSFHDASPYGQNIPTNIPTHITNQHAFAQNASANDTDVPPTNVAQESYNERPASTPSAFQGSISQPNSAQANNFSMYPTSSPPLQSPMSAPLPGSSPSAGSQGAFNMPPRHNYGYQPYPGNYQVQMPPAQGQYSAPIMANVGHPGNPMTLVNVHGGVPQIPYSSGFIAGVYSHNPPNPHQDRPFRCDGCPQSFNRNHDLKRHKRIHLAVKPFPCTHCDKTFSRKDALKRHILVKGCGKNGSDQKTERTSRREDSTELGDEASPIET
ncbi:uncharacterized protein KY384_006370 [Bacidia gigantensis]|uniref:uncharacterized protein n=1 Tax=Bacidia gigantensis TaxID=2732470 RepID=UPI001D05729A|nr:uncharacterized protein KY384_006370 [Bacidia gigantensis]KAG8528683.1 hypothetical protein KY384_006370 [Bacidia gigantensis]